MNYSTSVFLINKSVRAISVSYEPDPNDATKPRAGQNTTFKTLDQTIQPKDYVIIPTNTRWGMTVGRVETVDLDVDFDNPHQMEWVVAKVDRSSFEDAVSKEADAISAIRSAEVRRKREELAKALFADNEALRGLPISDMSAALPAPPAPNAEQ